MRLPLCVALCLPCAVAGGAPAVVDETAPASEGGGEPVDRPPPSPVAPATGGTVHAGRAGKPPSIDGRVDEGEWSAAPLFDAFVRNEPTEGGPGSERTE